MAVDLRIEQFKKMAAADPNNEIGHFSLGRALLDAGETAQAIQSFERVIALNPNISKVYQLLAQALLKENQRETAIARLLQGVKIAQERGDMMPRGEMIQMLKELGAAIPESVRQHGTQAVGEGQVQCSRCGKVASKMAQPPFSKPIGKEIQDKVCFDCWREWIGMGTKVINELRLPMFDPQAQKVFDQHMREFLNL